MPSPFRNLRVAAVAAVSLGFCAFARAQDAVPFQNLATDMMPAQMLERNLANLNGGAGHTNRRPVGSVRRLGRSANTTLAVTTYHASPAVAEKVKQQYTAWAKNAHSANSGKMAQVLGSIDIEKAWGDIVRENGLKSGDLIDAMAGYYLLNWAIANGRDADKTQTLAVRDQFRDMLGAAPALQRSTEAQRQAIAENLMINYLLQVTAYSDAVRTHNADLKARLGDAAAQRFQHEMGRDARQLRITKQGFAKKTG